MTDFHTSIQGSPAGTKVLKHVKVSEQNDGTPVTVPIAVVTGVDPGPTLTVTGAVHGDEYVGWGVIAALLRELDPSAMAGKLVGLPITNPFAYYAEARVNKFDYEYMNLNRIWPGDPEGYLSQRMAAVLFEQVLRHADAVIDFHEGGRDFMARYMIVGGSRQARECSFHRQVQLTEWFGQDIPIRDVTLSDAELAAGRLGMMSEALGRLGIPVVMPELGGGGHVWSEYVAEGLRGTMNVMRGMGLTSGAMEGAAESSPRFTRTRWVRPNHGGFIVNCVELGERVGADQTLGKLFDPFGNLVQTLVAPFDAVIMDTRYTTAVHPGDWAYHCADVNSVVVGQAGG